MQLSIEHQIMAINWTDLGTPDMATWLIDLMADDKSTRLRAINYLFDMFVNKGAESWENYGSSLDILTNDALQYVVQIIINMLQTPPIQDKAHLLEFLYDVARIISLSLDELEPPIRARASAAFKRLEDNRATFRSFSDAEHQELRKISQDLLDELTEQ